MALSFWGLLLVSARLQRVLVNLDQLVQVDGRKITRVTNARQQVAIGTAGDRPA